jgi:hypothetical protein
VRNWWQKKYVPKDARYDLCGKGKLTLSKYGTPTWVRDKKRKNKFYCKGCFAIIRDTGQRRPQEARTNIGLGIRKALEKGIIFGKTRYTLDESVFDTLRRSRHTGWGMLLLQDSHDSLFLTLT